jgi:hypothetical protein
MPGVGDMTPAQQPSGNQQTPILIYESIGGGKRINAFVKENNLGWCLAPDNIMNPNGQRYFHDCGTFHAEIHGKPWEVNPFKRLIAKYPDYDFVVLPDKPQIKQMLDPVAGRKLAMISLRLSLEYIDEIPGPVYFAVQDWMRQNDIIPYMDRFDGIFVGGSPEWKLKTAMDWAALAKVYKKKCHVGRINSYMGFRFMHYCEVDSVDGSTASRHDDPTEIQKYFDHLKYQQQLAGAVTP